MDKARGEHFGTVPGHRVLRHFRRQARCEQLGRKTVMHVQRTARDRTVRQGFVNHFDRLFSEHFGSLQLKF